MRVPSTTAKPLFSPGGGRRRDLPPQPPTAVAPPPSLSTSHSRRLRGSGSLKGAHSPMFAAVVAAGAPGRRRGYAFEAVEPSSPKVTCIGQVRVKSKKKKRKGTMRSGSKRAVGGEVSLRRREEEEEEEEYYCNNQGWACQIRASICEALKGAVSELNCFILPCVGRSKAIGEEEEAKRRRSSAWSCGAALARWVMAVEESEERGLGGGGEVVEVVVEEKIGRGGAVAEAEAEAEVEVEVVEIEEKGRVSVCVPPRNALLLMRCRSDPVRIAALESKFWGSPATKGQVDDDDDDDDDEDNEDEDDDESEKEYDNVDGEETNQVQEDGSMEAERGHLGVVLSTGDGELGNPIEGNEPTMQVERAQGGGEEANEEEAVKIQLQGEAEAEMELKGEEEEEEGKDEEVKAEDERKSSLPVQWQRCDSSSREEKRRRWRWRHSISSEREARRRSFKNEEDKRRASFSVDCQVRQCWSFSVDQKEDLISELNGSAGLELEKEKECSSEPELAKENLQEQAHEAGNEGTEATSKVDEAQEAKREDELKEVEEEEEEEEDEERDKCGGDRLPDCLLLMMYEPKLSMEVSKETWVSSNHFLHWHPHHHPRHPSDDGGANGAEVKTGEECDKCGGGDGEDSDSKEVIEAVNPASLPPPPPPPAQKLKPMVQTLYQPLVLTRCKSEPMRSAARLVPNACFWKDRYRPIGAAGIGV